MQHANEPFPALHSLEYPVPKAVWDLLDSLCRKDPAERPRSGAHGGDEIDRIIELLGRLKKR